MGLWVTSLNSGSNGNCYYIGNEQEAVLIDAGLSCRETEKRMRRLGLSIDKVKAIFISHEHGDHIKGVEVISKRYQIPVYITQSTLRHSRLALQEHLIFPFDKHTPTVIGSLSITAFLKHHDAIEPHSFLVEGNGIRIGVFTDIGQVCDQLPLYFDRCHAAFLEANYDEDMLQNGRYPYHLKKRISGGQGHLSNKQAYELFIAGNRENLSHLFLSHLSADNNRPDLALELFSNKAGNTKVIVASRYEEMPLHYIDASSAQLSGPSLYMPAQLNLFGETSTL